MHKQTKIWVRSGIALFTASAIEAVNLRLMYSDFYAGNWFLVLYFPLLLGTVIFGMTVYSLTEGIPHKRLAVALIGGITLSVLWLFVFALVVMRITGLGGELLTGQN